MKGVRRLGEGRRRRKDAWKTWELPVLIPGSAGPLLPGVRGAPLRDDWKEDTRRSGLQCLLPVDLVLRVFGTKKSISAGVPLFASVHIPRPR